MHWILRVLLVVVIVLSFFVGLFFWAMSTAYADGPFRPTNHYDIATNTTTPGNAYDTSDTSYSEDDIGLVSADSLDTYFGRDSGNADAWAFTAGQATCVSATIGVKFEHANAGNDWSTITVVDSADTLLHTIKARGQADVATTWVYTGLTSGEAADYGDLRVTVWGDRQGGNDASVLRVYDIRIDGTNCGGQVRDRIFKMTKEVRNEDQRIATRSSDGAVSRRLGYGRADPNDQYRPANH